jgi:hypothetical protein
MNRQAVVLALSMSFVLSFALALPAAAGTQNRTCAAADTMKALLYENSRRDVSDGDDSLWICDGPINLAATDHTLPGDCHVTFDFDVPTWGRCVSSVAAWVPKGYRLCMDWWVGRTHRVLQLVGPKRGTRYDIATDVITSAWFTSGRCL